MTPTAPFQAAIDCLRTTSRSIRNSARNPVDQIADALDITASALHRQQLADQKQRDAQPRAVDEPSGDGSVSWFRPEQAWTERAKQGKIVVMIGKADGEPAVAVKIDHDSGNQFKFLLTLDATDKLAAMLRRAQATQHQPPSATEARIRADCDIPPPVTPQEAEWRAAWQRADAALREVIVERDRLLAEKMQRQHMEDAITERVRYWKERCAALQEELYRTEKQRDAAVSVARDAQAERDADTLHPTPDGPSPNFPAPASVMPRPWQPGDVLRYCDDNLGNFIVRYIESTPADPSFLGAVIDPGASGWVKDGRYVFARNCFVPVTEPAAPQPPQCSCTGLLGHKLDAKPWPATDLWQYWQCSCGRGYRTPKQGGAAEALN